MSQRSASTADLSRTVDLATVLPVMLAVVLTALGVLFAVVAMRRLTGQLIEARRESLVRRARPLLLAVLADDTAEPEALASLAALPANQWRVLEPTVVGLLAKVRGSARNALVEVLRHRGALARAHRGTRSRSWVRRCEAAEMLGAARQVVGVPDLVQLLDDRSAEVRRVAARALGRIGDSSAARPLLESAVGAGALPVRDVAGALVLLEPAATSVIAAVAAQTPEPRVRAVAAEVLGLRGAVDAASLLVALMEHETEPEVRIRATRALGRLGVRAATAPLVATLSVDPPELRAVAARALGQLGAVDAVEALTSRLDDPAHRVAANVAEALAALGGPGLAALGRVADSTMRPRAAAYAREALAVHALGRRLLERAGA